MPYLLPALIVAVLVGRILRHLWRTSVGPAMAAFGARPVLDELARRRDLVRRLEEAAIEPGEEPAKKLERVVDEAAVPLLVAALTDAGPEVWSAILGSSGEPAERVRLRHEAALRGVAVGPYEGPDGEEPLAACQRAVADARRDPVAAPRAYRLLAAHAAELPVVSACLLAADLATATGDAELGARARERAAAAVVHDDPPATLSEAWRAPFELWRRDCRSAEPANVTAWRDAAPASAAQWRRLPVGARFAERLTTLRRFFHQHDQQAMADEGELPELPQPVRMAVWQAVHQARPLAGDGAEGWVELLEVIAAVRTEPLRAAALAGCEQLLRAARHGLTEAGVEGLGMAQWERHLEVARRLDLPGRRAPAMLGATALYGSFETVGQRAYDGLASRVAEQALPAFWAELLPAAAPWLCLVSPHHPARPWLLAAYLRYRWLGARAEYPWPSAADPATTRSGAVVLSGVLRDIVAAPVPPSGWALRGVPATERAVLDHALLTLLDDAEARGITLLRGRYASHAEGWLRRWARRG